MRSLARTVASVSSSYGSVFVLVSAGFPYLRNTEGFHQKKKKELRCLFFCPPFQKGKKRGRRPKGSGEATSEGASEKKVILSDAKELKF